MCWVHRQRGLCTCARAGLALNAKEERFPAPHMPLSAQAEFADQRSVPLDIVAAQVVEQPTTSADEHQQSSSRVVILLMDFQMIRQVIDSRGEECNLHLRRTGVGLVGAMLGNDFSS